MLEDENSPEIGDYFRSNLLAVRRAISQQEFKKFASLERNSDRVAFVLGYPESHQLSLDLENKFGAKDNERATQLKMAGNKFFARGEFTKALETYSNAVLLASGKDQAVILANRAAALYHLDRHQHALTDVQEASRLGYPTELLYKLEERRARCLLALNRHEEAVKAFRVALGALDLGNLPQDRKQKLEADIRLILAVMEKGKEISKSSKGPGRSMENVGPVDTGPMIQEDPNPLYPACSRSVEIIDDGGDVGRHAVAKRNLEPGEVLVVEEPHCAFLLAEYRLTHCHRCFSRIFAPIPAACDLCSNVAYCTVRCRDRDKEVHERECSLLPALWLSKASVTCFLAIKAILQRPFEEIIKIHGEMKASKGKFEPSARRPYKGKNYETFYGLVTHEDQRTTEDHFHRAYMAGWLLRLLRTGTYIPEEKKSSGSCCEKLTEAELSIADLLLHHLQLLQFNSHEISELTRPRGQRTLEKARSVFIGGGVYPTVALFNHSCNPGVVRYFVGTRMIVRAIRTIQAGEEIAENYGPIFTTTPIAERKRRLRVQYWFECGCEACDGRWPLLEEIDPNILRFKCETGPTCGNILPVRTDTNDFMIRCPKCTRNTNILRGLKALQDTDALFRLASRNLEDGNHVAALDAYLEILKLLDETLALPIRDYHLCQQGVRLCMLTLGNTAVV